MRIRLTFEDPLPAYKCWYEIPASCSTIRDLQRAVRKGFNLDQYCKTTRLDLDGFFLLPASTVSGSLKDGDLLQVMIRRRGDSLPPRHLPVSGGKKRSSKDAGLSDADRKSSKKMKSSPNKKSLALPTKQDNAQRQSGQGQQKQQQQSNDQNNNKKNRQNNKKAQQHSNTSQAQQNKNNKSQQNIQPLASNVSDNNKNAQGKGNKNKNANTTSNMNNNAKSNTSNNTPNSKGSKNNRSATRMPDHSAESQKVRFAPKSASQRKKTVTAETSSDSDSSDSESSSSSSDSSDSSKNSSDSTSSSDSDSSHDSASESDSNKKNGTKAVATRVIPGEGKGATKSRNTRRALLKKKRAEARKEANAGSDSDSSATIPLKKDYRAGTRLAESTSATSGKTAKTAASQTNGKDSAQDSTKKTTAPQTNGKATAPQANGKAAPQASAPPKVIMTSVDLKDSELVTKSNPKRVTRSSQKKPSGVAQDAPATPQPEILRQKDSQNNKTVAAEKESNDTSEVDTTPRDYSSLPKSDDNLAVGDVIAFKTLEMGPSYQPIISDFKEATVLSSSMTDMMAMVQLSRQFRTPVQLDDDGNPILGKFDIYDEEEFERARRGIVSLDILGLADCRIISKK
ncbi:hypothetical protein BGZ97_005099 [Linnemannia gamsii]|uniref:Coilin n=1 Tax=Linnemannia gamsii TaxID=64522 RepID=A0A9P6RHE1_9FUNG|nr:hypothetical protein BGZ97_005099 [Linnemannia gamsii]